MNEQTVSRHRVSQQALSVAAALTGLLMLAAAGHAQPPPASTTDAARRQDVRGVAAGDAGRLDEALRAFDEAVRLDLAYAPAHFHRGLALERIGRMRDSLAAYQQALRFQGDLFEARFGLASVSEKIGDLDGAIALLRQVVAALPDLAEARSNLGLNLWNRYQRTQGPRRAEDLDAALAELRAGVRLAPGEARFHAALGQLLADRQELQPAVDSLRRATGLSPDDPIYAYDLGLVLRRAGDLEGAEAQFRAVLRKTPAQGLARRALGLVLRESGDLAGAVTELRAAVELLPADAEAHHVLGSLLLKLGRKEALDVLSRAVALDPRSSEARVTLAQALARAGRKEDAQAQQAEVTAINAMQAGVSRAMLLLETAARAASTGDRAAALATLEEAVKASPGFPEAQYQLALAARPVDAAESERHFTRLVELDPGHAHGLYHLGVLRARRGDLTGAVSALRRATERAPGYVDAQRELAAHAWTLEDWPTVVASLVAVIAWEPGDAMARYALARALDGRGDREGAARELAIAQRLNPSLQRPK